MKKMTLGITGAIGAVDISKYLTLLATEYEINVILTDNALKFLTEQSIKYFVDNIYISTFSDNNAIQHIKLAQETDVFLILPATANIIGKIANGIADDLLSTTAIATNKPIIIAPSMNQIMWENLSVQRNIEFLQKCGHIFVNERKSVYAVCSKSFEIVDSSLPSPKNLISILRKYH